jgi:energy-coupling factor transport system ATP-binding protein
VTEFAARLSRLGYVDTLPLPITLNESIPYLEKTFSKWLRKLSPTQTTVQRQSPQQDGETIISVKDLHFAYPDGTVALRGVDLDIHSGEYVAIIGQNGSGKTTLVKHFGGLLKPTSGSVKLEGQETKDLHMTEVISKVGYVYQNPDHQIFCNTVLEECAFAPAHLGLPPDEVESRAKEAIEAVGLKGLENEQPFFLGKGQRQNLAVGSILAMRPKILIVDEPTTGQDMRRTDAMMSLIDKLNSLGRTIIIITHNMRIVAEHAKRTVVMTQGRISLDANTDEIFSHPEKLSGTFLKPPQITELAERFKLYAFSEGTLTVEQMTRSFIDLTMKPQEVDRVARTP